MTVVSSITYRADRTKRATIRKEVQREEKKADERRIYIYRERDREKEREREEKY